VLAAAAVGHLHRQGQQPPDLVVLEEVVLVVILLATLKGLTELLTLAAAVVDTP